MAVTNGKHTSLDKNTVVHAQFTRAANTKSAMNEYTFASDKDAGA